MPKVSHYNAVYFLRYTHPRYMKCLFTNIQKQQNCQKVAYFLRKIQTSRVNNSRILRFKNVIFSGYSFYRKPSTQRNFQICISVLLIGNFIFLECLTSKRLLSTRKEHQRTQGDSIHRSFINLVIFQYPSCYLL